MDRRADAPPPPWPLPPGKGLTRATRGACFLVVCLLLTPGTTTAQSTRTAHESVSLVDTRFRLDYGRSPGASEGDLDPNKVPATSAFTVKVFPAGQTSGVTVDNVVVSMNARRWINVYLGSTVTVDHSQTVMPVTGEKVQVTYTKPSTNAITNEGTEVDSFTAEVTASDDSHPYSAAAVRSEADRGATTSADGSQITLDFDAQLLAGAGVNAAYFTVTVDGTDQTPNSATVQRTSDTGGGRVVLNLATAVAADESVSVSYTRSPGKPQALLGRWGPLSGRVVRDFSVNVINEVVVTLTDAKVDGDRMTLTYDAALDETTVPSTNAYHVRIGAGSNRQVSAVAVSGSTVTLTLATAAGAGQAVVLNYYPNASGSSPLKGTNGKAAAGISSRSITNETAATIESAEVDGDRLTLTYVHAAGNALGTTQIPTADSYFVNIDGGNRQDASAISVSGSTVTLTLPASVQPGEAVIVSYSPPVTGPLLDRSGYPVLPLAAEEVLNLTKGHFQRASVYEARLGIIFDTEMHPSAALPDKARFTVKVQGAARNVNTVTRSGRTLSLELASPVAKDDEVTVSYQKPATNKLLTHEGREVAAFTDREVNNLTGRVPAVSSVAITSTPSLDGDGDGTPDTYGADETIDVDVEFSTAVEVDEGGSASNVFVWLDLAPNNTLNLDEDRRALPFHGLGRGGTIMRFRYTVGAADRDADGVFVQPDPNNDTVVFLRGSALVHGAGVREAVAVLTLAGLAFKGDPNHRVDGSGEVGDRAPPQASGATVDGTTLRVTFNEALDVSSAPAGDAFTVSGGRTGTGTATISGGAVEVTLDSPVLRDQVVTVSYEQPSANPLQDPAGNAVQSFSGLKLTNLSDRERPIADAGNDVEADPGERVTLDGSQSTDPNGDRLTFAWVQTEGETVALSGADSVRVSFTAPAASDVLIFRLTVTDSNGLTDADDVSVFVGGQRRPVGECPGRC